MLLAEIHPRIKNNLALVSSMLQLKEMNLDNELAIEALRDSKVKGNAKLKIRTTVCFDKINIEYCDCSGVFPDTVNFKDTSITGLMLIHTFIEQFNGSIELAENEPPAYAIKIPLL